MRNLYTLVGAGVLAAGLIAAVASEQNKKDAPTEVSFEGTRYHEFASAVPTCIYNERGEVIHNQPLKKNRGEVFITDILVNVSEPNAIKELEYSIFLPPLTERYATQNRGNKSLTVKGAKEAYAEKEKFMGEDMFSANSHDWHNYLESELDKPVLELKVTDWRDEGKDGEFEVDFERKFTLKEILAQGQRLQTKKPVNGSCPK